MTEKLLPDHLVEPIYSRLARHHDLWAKQGEAKAKARALELAKLKPGDRVLEVGVGTGLLFVEVVRALGEGGFALGVDRTEAMLEKARERMGGAEGARFRLERGDARALSVPDASFDLAFSCYMLDLLDEEGIRAVLGELARAVRPGGRVILANMAPAKKPWHGAFALLGRIDPRLFGGCRPVDLRPFLAEAGLRLLHQEYIVESLFPSEVSVAERGE